MNSRLLALRTMPYGEYLKTPEWRQKRDEALERDDHRCRACNSDEKLQVHHRTYEQRGNEDLNDLTTLCESCHEHFHRKMSQMEIMRRTHPETRDEEDDATRKERQAQKLEDWLIGMLIRDRSLLPHVCGIISEGDLIGSDTLALYQLLNSTPSDSPFEQSVPSTLMPAIARVTREEDKIIASKGKQVKMAIQMVNRLKRAHGQRTLEGLKDLMETAYATGGKELEKQIRQRMFETKKFMNTLDITTHFGD